MGKITAVKSQAHDPTRVSVFLDGEFFCGLYRLDAKNARIEVGRELPAGELAELSLAAETDRAYRSALRFLAVRPRSSAEVRNKLKTKGFSERATESAVERLKEEDYLCDVEFARAWVRDRISVKPKGRRALIAELVAKGVDRATAHSITEEILSDREEELASRVAGDYARRRRNAEPAKLKRGVYSHLIRRGFPTDVAAKAAALVQKEVL